MFEVRKWDWQKINEGSFVGIDKVIASLIVFDGWQQCCKSSMTGAGVKTYTFMRAEFVTHKLKWQIWRHIMLHKSKMFHVLFSGYFQKTVAMLFISLSFSFSPPIYI